MQLKTTDQTTFLIRLMCNIITILQLAKKTEQESKRQKKTYYTRKLGNNENIAQNNVKRKSNIGRATKEFYTQKCEKVDPEKEGENVICLHLSVTTTFLRHSDGIFGEILSFQFDCPRTLTRKKPHPHPSSST